MKAMKLDKYSTIEELEATLEKMVGKITIDNIKIVQKYANCADAGYEGHDTDAWNMMIYYPSPRTPKEPMCDYLHWWILMDSYEASLDKITTDVQEVSIQKCECGYLGTNFYGHIWHNHREFINPVDGSILESAMVKLQVNRKNGQSSDHQETSYKASNGAGWQAQDVGLEQKSDLQETAGRESIENVGLTTEISKENDIDENGDKTTKKDDEGDTADEAIKEASTPTDDTPVMKCHEEAANNKDNDKNDISQAPSNKTYVELCIKENDEKAEESDQTAGGNDHTNPCLGHDSSIPVTTASMDSDLKVVNKTEIGKKPDERMNRPDLSGHRDDTTNRKKSDDTDVNTAVPGSSRHTKIIEDEESKPSAITESSEKSYQKDYSCKNNLDLGADTTTGIKAKQSR